MCTSQPPAAPATAADAVAMVRAGLSWLATTDPAELTIAEQADCLRGLERARSVHTAAKARVLGSFHARDGYQEDGQCGTRSWLRWQARPGTGAAGTAVAWMRRLSARPHVADALAAAAISQSWAREICQWTDLLPREVRDDADVILLGTAEAGAGLSDLAGLAEELRLRTAAPDTGGDGGFGDTDTIPAHLRRMVIRRDEHCRFPGCQQPPVACQPHHIILRSDGGPTSLANLRLLCSFHHLTAIHRWGWAIVLHPDGTVAAASPDRTTTFHSHGPPARAA
jgi:hypothetical protein